MTNAPGDGIVLHPDYGQIISPTQQEIAHISQNTEDALPKIIQAGMGVNISSPYLAATVSGASRPGRETLGTISGTAVDRVMARMLQIGGTDADDIIEALADFPYPEVAERVIKKYHNKPNSGIPVFKLETAEKLRNPIELNVCANYAFVKMAKKGHTNPVSINLLEEINMPHLSGLYGALLAGVEYVTIGAGIALGKPAIFQAFAEGREATCHISVIDSKIGYEMKFNPKEFFGPEIPEVKIPKFLPIISTDGLANVINKRIQGLFAGFIIEAPIAGGHNARPRDKVTGEYGPKDEVNFQKMQEIGLPYWLAGGYASPEGLARALSLGAVGIQAGSIFALSEESGMRPDIREQILKMGKDGTLVIETDKLASPTGYPFKVADIPGSVSEISTYTERVRKCSECALRSPYLKPDTESIGYRCSSEPIDDYVEKKGGKREDTIGKKCLCNGLMATAGLKNEEPPIVTLGDDTSFIEKLLKEGQTSYSAVEALHYLFGKRA